MATANPSSSRPRWVRPAVWAVGVTAVAALAAPPAFAWDMHRTVSNNVTHAALLPAAKAPALPSGAGKNFLLIGTNNAGSAAGSFTVAHTSRDGERVDLVALPRDMFAPTFNAQGATAAIQKIESTLGIDLSEAALVGFDNVAQMTEAVGGVSVDGKSLDGQAAVSYVAGSGRSSQAMDDQRQLRFLKAAATKALSSKNPATISRFVDAASKSVTLDQSTTVTELESMAKDLSGAQVHTSRLSPGKAKALANALSSDDMASFTG